MDQGTRPGAWLSQIPVWAAAFYHWLVLEYDHLSNDGPVAGWLFLDDDVGPKVGAWVGALAGLLLVPAWYLTEHGPGDRTLLGLIAVTIGTPIGCLCVGAIVGVFLRTFLRIVLVVLLLCVLGLILNALQVALGSVRF